MAAKTILISGAGIAGPALAFWLHRAGFETTLVERNPELRTGGYIIDFWGLGYDIALRMGLAAGLESAGYHIREFRVVGDEGQRLAGFGTAAFRALTGGRFITLPRSDLSRLLFEAARPTSEILFDDEILSLQEGTDCVRVLFRRSGERDFDLVIGADGLSSNVRRLAFGPRSAFEWPLGYSVAAFEIRGYRPRDDDVYVIHNEPGRMVGRAALKDDRTLILLVFADSDPGRRRAISRPKRRYCKRHSRLDTGNAPKSSTVSTPLRTSTSIGSVRSEWINGRAAVSRLSETRRSASP